MNQQQHDRLVNDYEKYAASFADAMGNLLEMQQLKLDHSHRVAETARDIATREYWNAEEVLLAHIVGLYHDIARYQQYRDYHTFQDYRSVNHGEFGAKIIEETGILNILSPEEREIVIVATRYHNAKTLPEGLSPRQELFLKLDRDSDKIDIYEVLYTNVKSRVYLKYPEIFHGVDPEGAVSPEMLAGVRSGQPQSYAQVKSVSDFLLLTIQWTNELYFSVSRRLLVEHHALDHIEEIIKLTPEVKEVLDAARRKLEIA